MSAVRRCTWPMSTRGSIGRCSLMTPFSPTASTWVASTRAPLQQPGLGQLLQGAPAALAPRARLRAAGGRRGRPLDPAGAARRSQPLAARADARARRRTLARRVWGDPVVLRRGDAVRAGGQLRARAGAAVDVLRAVRPRAGDRALDAMETRLDGREWLVGDRMTLADIALYAYTHVAGEGGFELDRYPAIRAWLDRVAAQ